MLSRVQKKSALGRITSVIIIIVMIFIGLAAIGEIGSGVNKSATMTAVPSSTTYSIISTTSSTQDVVTTSQNTSSSSTISSFSSSESQASFVLPASCHSINGLADPACTPGATNPNVTQANIHSTICVSGYTATIRPNESYTENLKKQSIKLYGYPDTNLSDYEEDHLIPLEVGGNPTSVQNLWAEPHYGQYNSYVKDQFEDYLNAQVCSGKMSLAQAQQEVATNWVQALLATGNQPSAVSSITTTSTSVTSQNLKGLSANITYGANPIVHGNSQNITVTMMNGTSPLGNADVAVYVTYASGSTTKDLSCVTSAAGVCTVSWKIGSTADSGVFQVVVTVDGLKFDSSFIVSNE
jgi:hypothetical protein